ncbi:MDR family MFS transporter [Microbacterium sp. SLBN-146]|uniref:MDR family MFS transporter n=1 Tax=Microbacterium sp. SLBN-146 TaxID=2768457 RepID=UPI00114E9629|nr:MDR family MFS transporter [Microbacterium sp. SLBN-146]TQJ31210.1 EmrB/QacA subfamily drug resistance transporter [Microbacterium sp. SLBN-146]
MATSTPVLTESGMTRRQVLEALSGLLLGMFVSMLASTVVSTSLPVIVHDLGGDQAAFTWVVTATLLTTAISTPIWGKLADLFNRKLLIQIALGIFVLATAAAGFAQDPGTLIAFRAVQGLGAGGLAALSQILMADIISPRERGRYMGLFGAVMALATVGGPLLGGVVTDSLGWRWNFYIAIPFAIVALILLQMTLHTKQQKRTVRIDYLGIVFLSAAVSLLLIWVTNAGKDFDWWSLTTVLMVGGAILATVLFIVVELRTREPLIPLRMFRNRTFTLAVLASIATGIAMFGASVFLSQYMQMARGATPTEAGLMTIPLIGGLLVASIVVGQLISRFGKWKGYLVVGSILLIAGLGLLTTLHYDTNFVLVSLYMFLMGAGIGMTMQNLVLIVQNTARADEIGVASSGVTFFRSLGGTVGVSVMGATLAASVTDLFASNKEALTQAIAGLGADGAAVAEQLQSGTLPAVHALPETVRLIVEDIYAQGIAHSFLIAVPFAVVSLIAIAFLPNVPLTRMTTQERLQAGDLDLATIVSEEGMTDALPNDTDEPDAAQLTRTRGGRSAEPSGSNLSRDGR